MTTRKPAKGPRRQGAASTGDRKGARKGRGAATREEPRRRDANAGAKKGPAARQTKRDDRRAGPAKADAPRGPHDRKARPAAQAKAPSVGPRDARPAPPPPAPKPAKPRPLPSGPSRSGTVALIGRPNVGKSTLLNAALGQPLAAVSPVPQTTRTSLLGVVHHGTAELALLDTPGLHRPRTELGRVMNASAREAARGADVIVFMAEVPKTEVLQRAAERATGAAPPRVHPGDATLLADLPEGVPAVLVLNKVDRVRDKGLLLPILQAFERIRPFAALVPISALRTDGVAVVLDEIAKLLPEGPWRYGEDDVTDRPVRFFAAEYVREQILRATQDEVPHATAVGIERFLEPAGKGAVQIDATIHVERPGQKKILVGAGGAMLKRIGTEARLRIEELIGRKVNLKLWVRVTADWRESAKQIEELGYGVPAEEPPTLVLAELDDDAAGDAADDDALSHRETPGVSPGAPDNADVEDEQ
jgi:GTP-binding protein Era